MIKKEKGLEESEKSSHDIIHDVTLNALIAALYFALTIAFQPISFGAIQFRISEILVLICFFRKDLCIGLTIGCVLSNAFSLSYWDMLIGSGATLISSLLMSYCCPFLFLAPLYPIIFNGLMVGAMLTLIYPVFPYYWQNALTVAGGEAIILIVAYVIWLLLSKNKAFMRLLRPNVHYKLS